MIGYLKYVLQCILCFVAVAISGYPHDLPPEVEMFTKHGLIATGVFLLSGAIMYLVERRHHLSSKSVIAFIASGFIAMLICYGILYLTI